MTTKSKPLYKALLFLEIGITVAVLVALAVFLWFDLNGPAAEDTTPTDTGSRQETTNMPTEASVAEPLPEQTDKSALAANPLAPADFTYHGNYLTCLAADTTVGVDVSFWQGDINWNIVQAAGMEFAMIRLGFRGTEGGSMAADECVEANYRGARDAGMKVGGYFFSQAISVEEAVAEAEFVLELIKDWQIDMPIVYDWEYVSADARTGNVDARTLTDCTKAFCETVENAGYEAMIYFNEDQSHKKMYLEELTEYKFWLAKYEEYLDYPYRVDMWQYTCEGRVPGIDGYVDVNLYFAYS